MVYLLGEDVLEAGLGTRQEDMVILTLETIVQFERLVGPMEEDIHKCSSSDRDFIITRFSKNDPQIPDVSLESLAPWNLISVAWFMAMFESKSASMYSLAITVFLICQNQQPLLLSKWART